MADKISASEALYGFMGWLTSRDEVLRMSARHECSPAADAVKKFCDANDLDEPREDWHENCRHPRERI